MTSCWVVSVPDLVVDRVTCCDPDREIERPVVIVPTKYMLDENDAEEALFAALCQIMPPGSVLARKEWGPDLPCRGMGYCHWTKGNGWTNEPFPGSTYFDPFDLLKKTPFLYKV